MRPLDGITVVALEHAVAGPFATRQLADLGARVIKVERPEVGDFARRYDRAVHGEASYFVWLNRGKESVELDLKDGGDRSLLDRMLVGADVFVHNLAPGAVDRLGLDAAAVRGRNQSLVHCSISGYGPDGPYRDRKAYDLLVQCEAGLVSTTGSPDHPAKVGISVADIATGMYAYSGILSALYRRERSGEGATLDVAMLDALGEWMMQPAYYGGFGDRTIRRTGARHASIAPYGPYRVGDDTEVFLSVQSDREWSVLCRRVLDRPDLVDDPRFVHNPERVANDDAITELLEAAFAGSTSDELVARLDEIGIACARVRDVREFITHPQLAARDRWRSIGLPDGTTVPALTPPVNIAGVTPLMGDVPAFGAHSGRIRCEFADVGQVGFDD